MSNSYEFLHHNIAQMASCEYLNPFINLRIGICFVFYRRMESPHRLSDFYLIKTDSVLWRVGSTALERRVYSCGSSNENNISMNIDLKINRHV
jgi:hypothetical protein